MRVAFVLLSHGKNCPDLYYPLVLGTRGHSGSVVTVSPVFGSQHGLKWESW